MREASALGSSWVHATVESYLSDDAPSTVVGFRCSGGIRLVGSLVSTCRRVGGSGSVIRRFRQSRSG